MNQVTASLPTTTAASTTVKLELVAAQELDEVPVTLDTLDLKVLQ